MDSNAIQLTRTHQPDVVEPCQLFPRRAIDPDAALVEQIRGGAAGAVEALVSAYGDRVYRLAIRITGNAADAEEVVQDSLWAASRKIDTFRGAAAFGTWLYRITANTANQKLRGRRSKRNEVSWEDLAPSFDDHGQYMEVAVDWSRRLTDPAIEGELRSVLGAAIDELPADYRTAFLLRDVEGLPYSEIAETLHLKLATAKWRVHRTRLFLQRCLADYMGASPNGGGDEIDSTAGPGHRRHCLRLASA